MLGVVIGGAAAAGAAISLGYQSVSPTGQWFGRAFCGLRGGDRIGLTFDDGPNDPHTLRLLDVLEKHDVKATFFLIGRFVKQRPDIALQISRRGHVIGNHTFTHPQLIFLPAARVREEVLQCRQAISDAVGEHSNLFRAPWGGRRPGTFSLIRKLGLEPIMWSVTGFDWNATSLDDIERRIVGARGGDVVLLHDGGHGAFGAYRAMTVEATDRLIARVKAKQGQFATIPEMLG